MGEALKARIKRARFDDPTEEAILNILVTARVLLERLEAICSRYGITHNQFNILRILRGRSPEGYPLGEIAARMIERAPDITRLVDRLEAGKLVVRSASSTDRRVSIVTITGSGLALTNEVSPAVRELHREFRRRVGVRRCQQLSAACELFYGD